MTNKYNCRVCGKPILIMVNLYTGICSEGCKKTVNDNEKLPRKEYTSKNNQNNGGKSI